MFGPKSIPQLLVILLQALDHQAEKSVGHGGSEGDGAHSMGHGVQEYTIFSRFSEVSWSFRACLWHAN